MKIKLVIFCCFALLGYVQSQSPGYLGKHHYLKMETGSMFAVQSPTAGNRGVNTYGTQGDRWGLNSRWNMQYGYAFSRRHVLALEAGYMKTGMVLDAQTTSLYNEEFSIYTDNHYLFYHLRGISTGLSYQWYNPLKGSLAPMGVFTAVRMRSTFVKGEILDKQTYYGNTLAPAKHNIIGIDPKRTIFSAGVEIGQHTILFDRLMLSLSAEFNIPVKFPTTGSDEDSDAVRNGYHFEYAVDKRMQGHDLVMIKLGAGLLLF